MRIVYLEVENFRGIKCLKWAPNAGMNCLIGPGDTTKSTVLDAIEFCLNPRSYFLADDCDFHGLDVSTTVRITVTLAGLPEDFKAEHRYGLELRGWNKDGAKVEDEPGTGYETALSVRVEVDKSLEARWFIHNDRVETDGRDPPRIRFGDTKRFATNRLGPYAERHLSWARSSVLTRLGEGNPSYGEQLAAAGRAAREAFRTTNLEVFKKAVDRATEVSRLFAVPVRHALNAELDVQGVNITSGGIALHDGHLPLRRLGSGSARLLVAAFQHDAGASHVSLVDEIEYGLEPHRIARLLQHLKNSAQSHTDPPQIFVTTHSPVVILELEAANVFAVRCSGGETTVLSVADAMEDSATAQSHLRAAPEAFLARRILVGEGRTEQGLFRGLDSWWVGSGFDSFALQGAVAIDGGGDTKALKIAEHLRDLGYEVLALLDSNQPLDTAVIARAVAKGVELRQWPGDCSIEDRVFLDLPWEGVRELVAAAVTYRGAESIVAIINNELRRSGLAEIGDLTLPASYDTTQFRAGLGRAARTEKKEWFKSIDRGERVAAILGPYLDSIAQTPTGVMVTAIRSWVDAS